MGLRFRKSMKLMPGVRVNLGLRGASLSVGPRGSKFNLSKRGLRHTASLPGTGLSYQTQLYSTRKVAKQQKAKVKAAPVAIQPIAPPVAQMTEAQKPASSAGVVFSVLICAVILLVTFANIR